MEVVAFKSQLSEFSALVLLFWNSGILRDELMSQMFLVYVTCWTILWTKKWFVYPVAKKGGARGGQRCHFINYFVWS